MIVCSKRGPTIASALGFWLLLHTPSRLGACIVRYFSPSATNSCNGLSRPPSAEVASSLVLETGLCGFVGLGSLAGTGLSVLRLL